MEWIDGEEGIKVRSIIVETKSRIAVVLARQLLGIIEALDECERELEEESEEIEGMDFLKGIVLWERVGVMVYFNHREWKGFKEAQSASGMVSEDG